MNDKNYNEIKRLDFENCLWFIFAILCFINIFGDYNDIKYIKTNNKIYKKNSNEIFTLTIEVTLLIYLYFFIRNYNSYKNTSKQNQKLYSIKLLGSSFLIAGILCLLYFQKNQNSFIGSPAL